MTLRNNVSVINVHASPDLGPFVLEFNYSEKYFQILSSAV